MLVNIQMIFRKVGKYIILFDYYKSRGFQRFRFKRRKETWDVHMYGKCFRICFTVIYLILLLTWVPNVNQPLHYNT